MLSLQFGLKNDVGDFDRSGNQTKFQKRICHFLLLRDRSLVHWFGVISLLPKLRFFQNHLTYPEFRREERRRTFGVLDSFITCFS